MGDPIEHVIVLMLENRSFDQMLGSLQSVFPEVAGIDAANPRSEPDYPDTHERIVQQPIEGREIDPDPMHELENVILQLDSVRGGFVTDYAQSYPRTSLAQRAQVMGYYPLGALPVLHELAQNFAICDHWFSSMPGPTWPNRFFVHSGTSKGHVKMPNGVFDKSWHCYDQPTVFQRLAERGISWKIYHHGLPQSLVLTRQLEYLTHYHEMEAFFADAAGQADTFPQYCFIEPAYSGPDQNDEHPPSDVMAGELLQAQIYNALRQNEDLWNKSLLVFLYDEHGGFYDHVVPPAATPPDAATSEYAFTQYGVRVPALLISPWLDRACIKTIFDHTSVLKYVTEKWGLGPLGQRTATANSFAAELLKRNSARTDTPLRIDESAIPQRIPTASPRVNEHQKALVSFSHSLEEQLVSAGEDLNAVGARAIRVLDGPPSQFAVAKERVARLLGKAAGGAFIAG